MSDPNVVTDVVSPNPVDAHLAVSLLRENGVAARAFESTHALATVLHERTGCLVLVEEALAADDIPVLRSALERMPTWADLPLIVVARDVAALRMLIADAFPDSGNVTLLERPLSMHTFVSAVQVALRSTARQREVAELISERERAVKLRDEFLAMLAHELRNPLAPMRNALYLLRRAEVADPLVAKSTEILERQVNHVVRMVDDLMDVARLERGKLVLRKQGVDLNRVVLSAVETCQQGAQQRGHRITVRLAGDALQVDADAVRIEQIVCNLINNAAKFSPSPGDIRVKTSIQDTFASIEVEDDGIGFEPAAAIRLFDPFVQASQTLERSSGGLGMGLAIVKRLAELHGGSVCASSAGAGTGSRFVVRIPLAEKAGELESQRERAPAGGVQRRIVVIEDNPDIRETLQMLLTLWGHDVIMAADGPSGVQCVLDRRPDVALIDVGLPVMNGYEVARTIRRSVPNGAVRLIAVTGYGQPSDKERAIKAGFDFHLLKPIAPEVLERLLAE